MPINPKKSLGQHWLEDKPTLEYIVGLADVTLADTILEIGPGQGDLTSQLIGKAKKVVAIEKDEKLAADLSSRGNLQIIAGDILEFDLTRLPNGYKVVSNIPYYLTGKLLRTLTRSSNPPLKMVLLLQREVAQRINAQPGDMNVLAVSTQLVYETKLGKVIPSSLFTPPPKVDSQVLILSKRKQPLFAITDEKLFFRVVKAGFSVRRKKLRNSLSGGLQIPKRQAEKILARAGVDGELRAQDLNLQMWHRLCISYQREKN